MFEKIRNREFQCLERSEIENSNVWKGQNQEFQCLERSKLRIPMFGKVKIKDSYVWKEGRKNSNVWKGLNQEFQCLKKSKSTIPIFGMAEIRKTNVWKNQNQEFQSLEKPKSRIIMLRRVISKSDTSMFFTCIPYSASSCINILPDVIIMKPLSQEQANLLNLYFHSAFC